MDPNSSEYGSLTSYILQLDSAIRERSGLRLECLLSLTNPRKNPSLFRLVSAGLLNKSKSPGSSTRDDAEISSSVPKSWTDTVLEFWRTAHHLRDDPEDAVTAFAHCASMVQHIIKGFTTWEAWALPVLFSACRDVRVLAIRADKSSHSRPALTHRRSGPAMSGETTTGTTRPFAVKTMSVASSAEHLEEAARIINKAFTICITDRAPMAASRKWGTYCVVGILFRTYFNLDKLSLTQNVTRAITVSDLPDLHYFPKAHVVTWKYYLGVTAFLREDYLVARDELSAALALCRTSPSTRGGGAYDFDFDADVVPRQNVELILAYLIPTHLMTTRWVPSTALLRRHPRLSALYNPCIVALRSGNVAAYDRALLKGESEFIRRRTYLTLERARDLCLRSLFRRVWIVEGKGTRIPIRKFMAGMNLGVPQSAAADVGAGGRVDEEEAECAVANMIYKKFLKGYISRERRMVVLSANDPFPKVCQ